MTERSNTEIRDLPRLELTDADIVEAMKSIPGYLDITPQDFKAVYTLAYEHAVERLVSKALARDIMTKEVAAVQTDTPLSEVAGRMGQQGVSGVPVLDARGRVAGVISEKDFLVRLGVKGPKNFMSVVAECLEVKKCVALPLRKQKAGDIMSAPPVTVAENTPVRAIARLFAEKGINRVPVTDPEGRLLGIVSRADIVRSLLKGATA